MLLCIGVFSSAAQDPPSSDAPPAAAQSMIVSTNGTSQSALTLRSVAEGIWENGVGEGFRSTAASIGLTAGALGGIACLEARYLHMSCAGTHDPNLGLNGVAGLLGLSYFFLQMNILNVINTWNSLLSSLISVPA